MNRIQFVWGGVGFLGFACCALGQGVIANVERVIEQVVSTDPAIQFNCNRSGDLDLAVGPNRIVYTSNCKVRLVDPAVPGVALDEAYLRAHQEDSPPGPVGLLSPSRHPGPNNVGGSRFADPRVRWDERNQRFWIVAVELSGNLAEFYDVAWIHVAVSKTASPSNLSSDPQTGDWFTFTFDTRSDFVTAFLGLPDRPTLNTDGQTLFISIGRDAQCNNQQLCPNPVPLRQSRSVLIAISTTNLLAGNSPMLPIWNQKLDFPGVPEDTNFHCAARTYDALPVPQTQYFLATNKHPFETNPLHFTGLVIGQLDPDGSGGWKYSSQELLLPPEAWYYGHGDAVTPLPTGQVRLNGTSMIFWSVVHRAGSLWAVQTIIGNIGGATPSPDDHIIARWYEIAIDDIGGFSLAQWGDIDPQLIYANEPWFETGLEAFDPSISVNGVGDVAITYTITGPVTTFPSLCIGRRFRTSPKGKLPYNDRVRPGVATLDHHQYWSDFSGTESDGGLCSFWVHSLEAYDDGINPVNPIDHYQSWTAQLNLCVDEDMWADFDGDAELTLLDWVEFTYLHRALDRRADVNRDRRHDIIDFERVAHALRNVR